MLEKFLNGEYAVFLDKTKPDVVEEFYNLIYEEVKNYYYPWGLKLIDYFLSESSGPYFFVEHNKKINGGSLKYVEQANYKICTVEDFIFDLNQFEINENEYGEMFG